MMPDRNVTKEKWVLMYPLRKGDERDVGRAMSLRGLKPIELDISAL